MNNKLGSKQGSRHPSPDLSNDITKIIQSLRTHHVYYEEPGRTIEGDKAEVPNIQVVVFNAIGPALKDYNTMFTRLQARQLNTPLIGAEYMPTSRATRPLVTSRDSDSGREHGSECGAGGGRVGTTLDEGDVTNVDGSGTDMLGEDQFKRDLDIWDEDTGKDSDSLFEQILFSLEEFRDVDIDS